MPTPAATSPQENVSGRSAAALRPTHLLFVPPSWKCTANLSTILSYVSLEAAKLAPFSSSSVVPEACTPWLAPGFQMCPVHSAVQVSGIQKDLWVGDFFLLLQMTLYTTTHFHRNVRDEGLAVVFQDLLKTQEDLLSLWSIGIVQLSNLFDLKAKHTWVSRLL